LSLNDFLVVLTRPCVSGDRHNIGPPLPPTLAIFADCAGRAGIGLGRLAAAKY
jgi:hypothetical protein